MTTGKILIAAVLATSSIPAIAAVAIIGSSSARLCYEAAELLQLPTQQDMVRCNEAVDEAGLSHHDMVASYVNRGILKLRRGQVEESIADFDTALGMDPRQPEAYLNKGAALIRQDNARDALPLFTVALERHTNRPAMAHFGRAIANETLGNVAAAYHDYRRATELEPDWAEPRTELARFRVMPR